jgi:hypothetical protein
MSQDRTYTDKETQDLVQQLNAFADPHAPWRWVKARKAHIDWFGNPIEAGQLYLSRKYHIRASVRLSPESVDLFLSALFLGDLHVQQFSKWLKEVQDKRRQEAMREAIPPPLGGAFMTSWRPFHATPTELHNRRERLWNPFGVRETTRLSRGGGASLLTPGFDLQPLRGRDRPERISWAQRA